MLRIKRWKDILIPQEKRSYQYFFQVRKQNLWIHKHVANNILTWDCHILSNVWLNCFVRLSEQKFEGTKVALRISVEQESTFFFYSNIATSASYIIRLRRKRSVFHTFHFSHHLLLVPTQTLTHQIRQWKKNQCQPSKLLDSEASQVCAAKCKSINSLMQPKKKDLRL